MQDHHHLQFLGELPHGIEATVVEVVTVHIGVDLETVESQLVVGSAHLATRSSNVVHRQVGNADESIGMRRDDFGDAVVLDRGRLRTQLGIQPVVVLAWVHRQHLHVDSLEVHVGDPSGGFLELVGLSRPQLSVVTQALLGRELNPGVLLRSEVRAC